MFGGEGYDGDGILEAGNGESGDLLSKLSDTKSPSNYVGGCPNKESTLDSSSETGAPVGGLTLLSFYIERNNIRDHTIILEIIMLLMPTLILKFTTEITTALLIDADVL